MTLKDLEWAQGQGLAVSVDGLKPGDQTSKSPAQLQITSVKNVIAEKVDWLWDKRLPKGKLTIVGGDPGLGKSYMTLALPPVFRSAVPGPMAVTLPKATCC
jgi:hypothetical protein